MSKASLESTTLALKAANDKLAQSVSSLRTIPPKAPTCIKCGKVRRPFSADELCDGCKKAR